jgi:hypothetical protein
MVFEATVYRVFVASPSDVEDERKLIPEVISAWNSKNSLNENVILLPIMWETNSVPEMGDRAQAIINRQLGIQDCDILIGVFGARLGSDTGVEVSGTVEEIKKFLEADNASRVMLFFSTRVAQSFDELDPDQITKLKDFKNSCRSFGIVGEYDSPYELGEKIRDGLSYRVRLLGEEKLVTQDSSQSIDEGQLYIRPSLQLQYPLNHEGGLLRARDRFADALSVERPDSLIRNYFIRFYQQKPDERFTCEEWPDIALNQFKDHTKDDSIWETVNIFKTNVSKYEISMVNFFESIEQSVVEKTGMIRVYTGGCGSNSPPSLLQWFTTGLFDYVLKLLEGLGPAPWQWQIIPIITINEQYPNICTLKSGSGGSLSDAAVGPYDIISAAKEVQRELLEELLYCEELQSIYDKYQLLFQSCLNIKNQLKNITLEQVKNGHCRGCVSQ